MPRSKVNVFYYPAMVTNQTTLKKAILFFDEIHFMDRPSFQFKQFGMIGMGSPMRQFEDSFRENGVGLYVHDAPYGPVIGDLYQEVCEDINDLEFLKRYQAGLRKSSVFRDLQVAKGNYGAVGTHEDVARMMIEVDLPHALSQYSRPLDLFSEQSIHPFDMSTPMASAKSLLARAAECSAIINYSLGLASQEGFVPFADATPYGALLGAKYIRAKNAEATLGGQVQITDLAFAIFDELVPAEQLENLSMRDTVRIRKASEKPREAFLEHLVVLQAKQAQIGPEGDYEGTIRKVIDSEIVPAARKFRSELQTITEAELGCLAKGAFIGAPGVISLLGHISWPLLLLSAAAYVGKTEIDAYLAERRAKRDCAISYILSLDKLR